jgi:hypothetical protein
MQYLGGTAKGLPFDDGGFPVRRTIVKARGLGDVTPVFGLCDCPAVNSY